MKKNYKNINLYGNKYVPNTDDVSTMDKLLPGFYTIHFDSQKGLFWFQNFIINHDDILELPSPEYVKVTTEMRSFLTPEKKKKFKDKGYIYKRSSLLFGAPGTGKSVIVNRIANDVVNSGGICLWAKNPDMLTIAYEILECIQPEDLVLVILEEFDDIVKKSGESLLLSLLDGQIQKSNVIYLATTNYREKIPARLLRPGRMSSCIEVKYPIAEARESYLTAKLDPEERINLIDLVKVTEGLSIDELKEVVQSVFILDNDLTETIDRLKKTRDNTVDPRLLEDEWEEDEDEFDTTNISDK